MVYQQNCGDCLPQQSISFSLRFQSPMSTQTSGALKAFSGWPQFLNYHSEQAPTFLSGCYLNSSEIGRGANECPCNEGRMASWGEDYFIPTVLTYTWEPTEDWIACKRKNTYRWAWIFCSKIWYLEDHILPSSGLTNLHLIFCLLRVCYSTEISSDCGSK